MTRAGRASDSVKNWLAGSGPRGRWPRVAALVGWQRPAPQDRAAAGHILFGAPAGGAPILSFFLTLNDTMPSRTRNAHGDDPPALEDPARTFICLRTCNGWKVERHVPKSYEFLPPAHSTPLQVTLGLHMPSPWTIRNG